MRLSQLTKSSLLVTSMRNFRKCANLVKSSKNLSFLVQLFFHEKLFVNKQHFFLKRLLDLSGFNLNIFAQQLVDKGLILDFNCYKVY